VALLIILALVLVIVLGDHDSEEPVPLRDRIVTEVPSPLQRTLAERFRPRLFFDTSESWRPLNVADFLAESTASGQHNQLCDPSAPGNPCENLTGRDSFLTAMSRYGFLGQHTSVDILGSAPNGADYSSPNPQCRGQPGPVKDCNQGDATAIYYHVVSANDRLYVDYWWFFRYNDFKRAPAFTSCTRDILTHCDDHEGDWEGITVVAPVDAPHQIEYATFAQHEGGFRYGPQQLELQGGTRPSVYVADGSHASYPQPCSHACAETYALLGPIRRPEGSYDGARAWGRNSDPACYGGGSSCLIRLPDGSRPDRSWDAYAGVWGKACLRLGSDCSTVGAPPSPSQQLRFHDPWCAQLLDLANSKGTAHETCDQPTPGLGVAATAGLATNADCEGWSGQLASLVACDQDRLAGRLATAPTDTPTQIRLGFDHTSASDSSTPGVAQLVGKPLRAGDHVIISGTVTNIIVRMRGKGEAVQATFDGLSLNAGSRSVLRVETRGGRSIGASLRLANGSAVTPRDVVRRQLR
jgi:hypothetical protein